MILLRGFLLSWLFSVISLFAGTAQRLPALPNGASAQAVKLDAAGNIYVAGSLPGASGQPTDAFVAKLSPDGSKVVYFTKIGGSQADQAFALAVGSDGSAYVTGLTSSTDFPVTKGALDTTFSANTGQAFAAKLDPAGAIQYATYLGGTVDTAGFDIAVDKAGDAFIMGSGAPPAIAEIPGGSGDLGGFVIKLDPTGSKALLSFTGLGGAHIAVDAAENIYITGGSLSVPPFTAGAFQTSQASQLCGSNGFFGVVCTYTYVAKADVTGTKLLYLTGLNGAFGATPAGIAVDSDGEAIVAGTTNSPDFPVTAEAFESIYPPTFPPVIFGIGPHSSVVPPSATGFVAKLNATGSALIWSTYFGGSATDSIRAMSVDSDGGIVVGGLAGSSDLPGLSDISVGCWPSVIQQVSFATRLSPDGTSASSAQLFYGEVTYSYEGGGTWPIAVASTTLGSVFAVETSGAITAADLFAPSRLGCVTDPADNLQLIRVAPGQDLTLFGAMLAPTLLLLPGQTGVPPEGVTATFDGNAATILYASPGQVNLQVPPAISGQTSVAMHVTNAQSQIPLDATRTFPVVAQQPSVFLTVDALFGATPACDGNPGPAPNAVALNADGSRNSVSDPAAVGSQVTIFLNGVAPGAAITGLANGNPVTFSNAGLNEGALAVSFKAPAPEPNGVALSQLQADGTAIRESAVTVCVAPAGSSTH